MHDVPNYGSKANALLAQLEVILHWGQGNHPNAVAILHRMSGVKHQIQAPSRWVWPSHTHASHIMNQGPAADNSDLTSHAEQFCDFLGHKAELWCFKDGCKSYLACQGFCCSCKWSQCLFDQSFCGINAVTCGTALMTSLTAIYRILKYILQWEL